MTKKSKKMTQKEKELRRNAKKQLQEEGALPLDKQMYIAEKYYNGHMPWKGY